MEHSAQHPVDPPPRQPAEQRTGPAARRSRKLVAPLLATALVAVLAPVSASASAPVPAPQRAGGAQGPCLKGDDRDGWTATATQDRPQGQPPRLRRQRLPRAAGAAQRHRLRRPRRGDRLAAEDPGYDGSFVSGLYAKGPGPGGRQAIAAIPTWTTLDVATGGAHSDTFSSATAPGRISHYRQTLSLRCGFVRTSLTWTAADGRATDLVYDVLADRNDAHTGAVRLRMTPHWSGAATVTDGLDGRGARRMTPSTAGSATGGKESGGKESGGTDTGRTMDVGFRTDRTKTEGAVASTLRTGPGVRPAAPAGGGTGQAERPAAVSFPVRSGRSYELAKYVGVDTALTSRSPRDAAGAASRRGRRRGWDALFARHAAAWRRLWRSDIEVEGRPDLQSWVRSAQYGLLSSTRAGAATTASAPPA